MDRRSRTLSVSDNLEAMASLDRGLVDLVYMDPPFNSGRSYEAVIGSARRIGGGQHRIEGFSDHWGSTDNRALLGQLTELAAKSLVDLIARLTGSFKKTEMAGYLLMMAPRLTEAHRLLAESGSLYLHCDPAAGHYLKIILDQIFGPENFRNEIIWKRTHAHSSSRRYGPIHDVILFYSKSSRFKWTPLFSEYQTSYIENHFTQEDDRGRFQLITCTAPGDRQGTRAHYEWKGQYPPSGRHWAWKREKMEEFEATGRLVHSSNGVPRLKRYTDDGQGVPLQDMWLDINRLDSHSHERVGYETQKPVPLLERIIAASTQPGDLVLDPFCGSGTTLLAAEKLGRQWSGIDSSLLAACVSLSRVRQEADAKAIRLHGFPNDEQAARRLYINDPMTFGMWGTSILGTVADRKVFNGSVAVGAGCLKVERKRVQLLSWIPIATDVVGAVPTERKGHPIKHGFVLRMDEGFDCLRDWLETRIKGVLHEVNLSDLVAKGALQQGLAPEVVRRILAA